MWKLTLVLFIVNNSIATKQERITFENTLKSYASVVGVDLAISSRNLKERFCSRHYPTWKDGLSQYYCFKKRYTRQKKGQLNMFVRVPFPVVDESGFKWDSGGGRASICAKRNGGIAVVAYVPYQPLPSAIVGVHELFHNLGAQHQETDPNEVMFPYYISERIEKNKGAAVSEITKESIRRCLDV